jgi:glucose-1-phosphate cytidylyltransferase
MKVVLLAGGLGTRLNEETQTKPKPMVEIGGKPILWHIMKIYAHHGYTDFVVCLGYKSHYIKEWFHDYFLHNSDFTLDLKDNTITYHRTSDEKWKISFIETGALTMTGGRLKRIKEYLGNETFMMTYGDGVADIDIKKLVDFHKKHKKLATISSVFPEGRFGTIFIDENSSVTAFSEKTDNKNRVNGGFFVLEPGVLDYLEGDDTVFEKDPLEKLAQANQLKAFHHDGFWKPMDTLNDKNKLDALWNSGQAPWKLWN